MEKRVQRVISFLSTIILQLCAWGVVDAAGQGNMDREEYRAAFESGERLDYVIYYGIARGAEARVEVRDTLLGGGAAYHMRVAGWTRGLLDRLYPVYDVYHSYMPKCGGLPVRAIRDVREQEYTDYKEDCYDRALRADSLVLTRENGERHVLPRETMDLVSVVFYVRNRLRRDAPRAGEEISIPIFFNGEFYPFRIQYKGIEMVKTPFGRLRCYRFVPLVKEGDLFKSRDAISVWLTADGNHVPVRVRFKLFLGSLYCDLKGFSGLRWPLEVEAPR